MRQPSRVNANTNPPATNRGVEKQISVSIDWISVTFKPVKSVSYPAEIDREMTECKPVNGYNVGVRYTDGRIELTHTLRPEMGCHVIASGQTLRAMKCDPIAYLKHVVSSGARVTRLDIAIDAKNCNLVASDATKYIKNGEVITRAKQFPAWSDPTNKGYTQYIGKKTSSAFVRIYNKAAEVGVDGDWTRVECSFGERRANQAAQAIIQNGDFIGLVRGFVDFPEWENWQNVMSDSPVQTVYEKRLSNTRKWLLEQCAPTLAREVYLDGEDEFYFRFNDAVAFNVQKLKAKNEAKTA